MKRKAAAAVILLLTAVLAGCSSTPSTEQKQAPAPAPEPITGRQAFQTMFIQARTWSPDATPLELHSLNLKAVKSMGGKAGAWRGTFVSESHGLSKSYTWSAIEGEGLHQGVFGEQDEHWMGPNADQKPFAVAALKFDSDDVWKIAAEKSAAYMEKHPGMPVSYYLTYSNRYPDLAWRVVWGESVASSDYSVFVDATTGKLLGVLKG